MSSLRRPTVALITTGPGEVTWRLGRLLSSGVVETAVDFFTAHEQAVKSEADAILFWDPSLGSPPEDEVLGLLEKAGDAWHAGLSVGRTTKPRSVGFIEPLWMHNCDAAANVESTSWRLTPRSCLVRREVLVQLGAPDPGFHSIDAAAFELGLRWLRRGAFVRHTPLLASPRKSDARQLDVHDELRLALHVFDRRWATWAALRGVATKYWSAPAAVEATAALSGVARIERATYRRKESKSAGTRRARVSVVIPTLDRYSYLRVILEQLRRQSVQAHEVFVVDQTRRDRREEHVAAEFEDLPLHWMTLDQAGQCSSRNAALDRISGDCVLFVDDDSEIPPDNIERHLSTLARFDADASCGVADEVGIAQLPEHFSFMRTSDVFPTNNTMVRRSLLERTGCFDLAFDRQQRADADLGLRAHLSGAFIVLDPDNRILHHHAPSGGLREHGARKITYASSRAKLMQRHLPSASELYLASRYFDASHERELLCQKALGTLSSHGTWPRRVAKALLGALSLPNTLARLRVTRVQAQAMLEAGPRIPALRTT